MSFDLTWLLDVFSHPLFISIASVIVGAIVGGLVTRFLFNKQMNWQAMIKHFEDLKAHAITPLLEGLEDIPAVLHVEDPRLFGDLRNEHYPELNAMLDSYAKAQEEEKKEEKALREEICKRVELLLKKDKVKFDRSYKVILDVCFSSYVVEYVYGVLELNKRYANVLIKRNPSANLFFVKIDGTEVFRTSDEAKANRFKGVLDNITKTLVVESDLKEKMKYVKELRGKTQDKRNKLINTLRDLKGKTKLKLRKKFRILPRLCKYLKEEL